MSGRPDWLDDYIMERWRPFVDALVAVSAPRPCAGCAALREAIGAPDDWALDAVVALAEAHRQDSCDMDAALAQSQPYGGKP